MNVHYTTLSALIEGARNAAETRDKRQKPPVLSIMKLGLAACIQPILCVFYRDVKYSQNKEYKMSFIPAWRSVSALVSAQNLCIFSILTEFRIIWYIGIKFECSDCN